MNPTFNDQNQNFPAGVQPQSLPLIPGSGQSPSYIQPPQSGGLMNYIRNNKWVVLVAIIILAALIYWFYMRKNAKNAAPGAGINASNLGSAVNKSGFTVNRNKALI